MKNRFIIKMMILWMFCCMIKANALASEPIPIFVSITPQKYFAEKIGGKHVTVSVMVAPGASPASYEPKPKQMVALSKAKIYYAIGVPFEQAWLGRIAAANPKMLMVHTEEGVKKHPMKAHHHDQKHENDSHDNESHDETKTSDHEGRGIMDPHIWLSPGLVKIQADNMLRALVKIDPANRSVYKANHQAFAAEIDALDAELRAMFAEKGKKARFMVFHPSWGYFAHAYGLEQVPVEVEGKSPKPSELQRLIQNARTQDIRMIFVQPQFSSRSAQVIANAIGGQIAVADPLAENWADNLREVAMKLKTALK